MPKPRPAGCFKWWPTRLTDGRLCRFDAYGLGEPDFHAYIVRYTSVVPRIYGSAWCWRLIMPRASRNEYNGWASSPHEAKRQVEHTVRQNW